WCPSNLIARAGGQGRQHRRRLVTDEMHGPVCEQEIGSARMLAPEMIARAGVVQDIRPELVCTRRATVITIAHAGFNYSQISIGYPPRAPTSVPPAKPLLQARRPLTRG